MTRQFIVFSAFTTPRLRKFALDLFAERIRVADGQRRRHPFREIERVGHLDQDLPAQIRRARLPQRRD